MPDSIHPAIAIELGANAPGRNRHQATPAKEYPLPVIAKSAIVVA